MKLSAKSRYALATMVYMGQHYGAEEHVSVVSLSEKLGISKIYLEQVFSLLKRGGVVISLKGAQGGYQLARPACEMSVYDILSAIEGSLFEEAGQTVQEKAPDIESVLQNDIFQELDKAITETLKQMTLDSLAAKAGQYGGGGFMYFI